MAGERLSFLSCAMGNLLRIAMGLEMSVFSINCLRVATIDRLLAMDQEPSSVLSLEVTLATAAGRR